jgi:ribosomal protein S18 acetylase RimI-like enzyme
LSDVTDVTDVSDVTDLTDEAGVLGRFDREVRQSLVSPAPGWAVERVGAVIRITAPAELVHGCYVEWSDLDATTVDAEIAAQVAHFGGLRRRFEWKTYGYDGPPDLCERLARAGFVAEETEALVIGPVDAVTAACAGTGPPSGVRIRVIGADDVDAWAGIGRLHELVWGRSSGEWVSGLVSEIAADPTAITVLVAESEDAGEVVCAGWVRFCAGTAFASLWGGSTAPAWRGQGIYRAMVGQRAALAAERGFEYLQVDASPDSRPILERLGLRVLTTTTPYIWTP